MEKTKMLKKNYEFKNVLTKGRYYGGSNIEAFVKSNNSDTIFLGIAISKKIGKAVQRNRIKRLIRESYRLLEQELQTGYSIVLLWKKKADPKNASFEDIKKDMRRILKKRKFIMKKVSIFLINRYKKDISPIFEHFGATCKYHPSCSEYTKQAIQEYGTFKGVCLGVKRILRCNPFFKGGYDPVNRGGN